MRDLRIFYLANLASYVRTCMDLIRVNQVHSELHMYGTRRSWRNLPNELRSLEGNWRKPPRREVLLQLELQLEQEDSHQYNLDIWRHQSCTMVITTGS